ncbi:hypothetical protein ON010_g11518 [Phytophthora cinnamomi]|nr:hypothetical protein ON010_g11518 [Phytophthora cinnamomi]
MWQTKKPQFTGISPSPPIRAHYSIPEHGYAAAALHCDPGVISHSKNREVIQFVDDRGATKRVGQFRLEALGALPLGYLSLKKSQETPTILSFAPRKGLSSVGRSGSSGQRSCDGIPASHRALVI